MKVKFSLTLETKLLWEASAKSAFGRRRADEKDRDSREMTRCVNKSFCLPSLSTESQCLLSMPIALFFGFFPFLTFNISYEMVSYLHQIFAHFIFSVQIRFSCSPNSLVLFFLWLIWSLFWDVSTAVWFESPIGQILINREEERSAKGKMKHQVLEES